MKYHPGKVLVQAELAFLIGVEGQVVAFVQVFIIQVELLGGFLAHMMIPPVGEQNTTNV